MSVQTIADQINSDHLALESFTVTSPMISRYLEELPKGPGTSCPVSPTAELAKFMAYRLGDVDWSDVRVLAKFLETTMTRILDERHESVFQAFTGSERDFMVAAADVADATNVLYLAWLRRLVIPWNDLPAAQREGFKQRWNGKLPKYDYTVYSHDLLRLNDRVAWATAFPAEIAEVVSRLNVLHDLTNDHATRVYLDALMDAYEETDVAKLEQRWAEVDEKWILIPADAPFVIIHGMENYEHPHGVSPEFRLVMRITNAEQASEIAAFRAGTQASLTQYGLTDNVRLAAHAKLGNLDVGIFMTLIEGGVCLRKKLAGQVIPNRQTILARGGKVFLTVTEDSYLKILAATVRQHCTPEAAEMLVPLLTSVGQRRLFTGHEIFHPVGCTPETEALLGPAYKLLEEAKATCGGLVTSDGLDSSLEARQRSAATCIARVLRFMNKSRLEDASVAEYIRESIVLLETLLDAEVIRFEEGRGLSVTLCEANLDCWMKGLKLFLDRTITGYNLISPEFVADMRRIYCGDDDRGSPSARALIAWVNRE